MIGKTLLIALLTLTPSLAQIPTPRRGGSAGLFRSAQVVSAPLPAVERTQKTIRLSAGLTLRVPQQYYSIQSTIDAAPDGDAVLVSRGTCFEKLRPPVPSLILEGIHMTDNISRGESAEM